VLNEALSLDFTACFNAKLILEALKAFDCENVGIQLMNAKTPMILEAEALNRTMQYTSSRSNKI
jgi:DNA polymerase III sliding clamp (beta) subunit (PCNA family)